MLKGDTLGAWIVVSLPTFNWLNAKWIVPSPTDTDGKDPTKKNQKQNRNTLMLLPSVAGVLYLTREFVAHMLLINTEYRLQ